MSGNETTEQPEASSKAKDPKATPPEKKLSFEIVKPRTDLHGAMVFYGQPKVGKSTLAASLTEVSIDTENGLKHIAGVKRLGVSSLPELREAVNFCVEQKVTRIAIDTLDYIHAWLSKFVVAQYKDKGIKAVGEIDWGAGWAQVEEHMLNIMSDVRGKFDLVIFVAHQRQATFGEQNVKARLIDLPGKLSRKIAGEADQIGFCEIERLEDGGHSRFINFKPYEDFDSGGRLTALKEMRVQFYEDRAKNALIFKKIFEAAQKGDK